jgi:diguanylate cyclase (GGDEF)-like protein
MRVEASNRHAAMELHRFDAGTVARLARVESACLAGAGMIAFVSLLTGTVPAMSRMVPPWAQLSSIGSVAALACSAALGLSRDSGSRARRLLGALLAWTTAGCAVASLVERGLAGASGHLNNGAMPAIVATAYVLLGTMILLVRASRGVAGWIADIALFGLGWTVLVMVMAWAFGAMHLFGVALPVAIQTGDLVVLTLLGVVAFARRCEFGRFSIFLGRGVGSRTARGLLPVVLVLPFVREVGRARMVRLEIIPEHYAAAVLASGGTMIALMIVMLISRQIRRLERDIQDLSLRDQLTGLYNLRGFHLLAEQAFRMAQRADMPFSVLFVDVDDLKQTNDLLGHGVGSQMLVETAKFLQTHFRETDVLGRIGGDEFAVAGQFSPEAIELAEERLETEYSDGPEGSRPTLSLSMGHVTADPRKLESLEDLLDRADAAMYKRKRLKKLQAV